MKPQTFTCSILQSKIVWNQLLIIWYTNLAPNRRQASLRPIRNKGRLVNVSMTFSTLQNHITLAIVSSQLRFNWNFVLLRSRFYQNGRYKFLHMTLLYFRGICKIFLRSGGQELNYKAKLKVWIKSKMFNEIGPWFTMYWKLPSDYGPFQ